MWWPPRWIAAHDLGAALAARHMGNRLFARRAALGIAVVVAIWFAATFIRHM